MESLYKILESVNLSSVEQPIYDEVIKMFGSKSKKEWNKRFTFLMDNVMADWKRVYKQYIPQDKNDNRLYIIMVYYSPDNVLYDKGLTGEMYIGYNNKKGYKVYPKWTTGSRQSEKYGHAFDGIKCIKMDKKMCDIKLDHSKIENIYIVPAGYDELYNYVKKMSKL